MACTGAGLTSRFRCSKCTMFPRSWALPASSSACSSCMLRELPRAAWPEVPLLCSSCAASAKELPCSALVLTALGVPALVVLLHLSEQNFTSSQQDSHFLRLQVSINQTMIACKESQEAAVPFGLHYTHHVKGLLHTAQVLLGRFALLTVLPLESRMHLKIVPPGCLWEGVLKPEKRRSICAQ